MNDYLPLERPIRVLLAEDHLCMRQQTRALLESSPIFEVVAEASDGPTTITEAERLRPDIVLIDITLPHEGGLKTAMAIRSVCPESALVVLSLYDDSAYVERALLCGADALVTKLSLEETLFPTLYRVLMARRTTVSRGPQVTTGTRPSSSSGNEWKPKQQATRFGSQMLVQSPFSGWLRVRWRSLKRAFTR